MKTTRESDRLDPLSTEGRGGGGVGGGGGGGGGGEGGVLSSSCLQCVLELYLSAVQAGAASHWLALLLLSLFHAQLPKLLKPCRSPLPLGGQPPFTTKLPPFTLWPQRRERGGENSCQSVTLVETFLTCHRTQVLSNRLNLCIAVVQRSVDALHLPLCSVPSSGVSSFPPGGLAAGGHWGPPGAQSQPTRQLTNHVRNSHSFAVMQQSVLR